MTKFIFLFISAVALAKPLTFEAIESYLKEKQNHATLEETLGWIREQSPEQMGGFTLMRESSSLQGASPLHPRAISFGKDAKLIFTFNGHPQQKGFSNLEFILFRPKQVGGVELGEFEFREIEYRSHGEKTVAKVSTVNPAQCFRCHLTSKRPIWESYDVWEGTYGRHDDAILDFVNDKYALAYSLLPGGAEEYERRARTEWKEFKDFKTLTLPNSRYEALNFPEGSPVSPYSPEVRGMHHELRPNLAFTESLSRLQAKNLVSQAIKQSGACLESSSELLLAALLQCENDSEVNSKKLKKLTDFFVEKNRTRLSVLKMPWRHDEQQYGTSVARALPALLEMNGIEFQDWQMARTEKQWSYFVGTVFLKDLFAQELYLWYFDRSPWLGKFTRAGHFNYQIHFGTPENQISYPLPGYGEKEETKPTQETSDNKVCRYLIAEAEDKFLQMKESCLVSREAAVRGIPLTAKMCASCHEDAESDAPSIPFSDSKEILGWKEKILSRIERGEGKGQMPPNRPLTQKEKSELRAYLSK